ncbi:hypothetical protein FSP39_002137 [Pinctada imbricata]|uniref:Uncharacterized protein n=1 Tax=Pinctada imbricata TaxID=66713 RepID=A0AA89C5D7_PINIB|nr:hypothetical protein FSP39_002137 [Pinctada imbricata]
MNLEITGPTLIDLKLVTATSYEDVARAASGRGFGFFIGAFCGGFLVEKLYHYCDVMVAIFVSLMGILGIVIPNVDASLMFVVILFQGICEGVINIAGQKLLLEIWMETSASPMHTLHLGFGIGSLVVPQIAEPFLAVPKFPQRTTVNTSFSTSHENGSSAANSTSAYSNLGRFLNMTSFNINEKSGFNISQSDRGDEVIYTESNVKWAYLIVAILAVMISTVFFIFQFCGKSFRNHHLSKVSQENTAPSIKTIVDPKTCTGGDRIYGVNIFVLLFLFCFQAFGIEYICSNFLRSYSIDKFHMSGEEAAWLNTSFWISYTLGCFCGFVVSSLVNIRFLILIQSTSLLLASFLLLLTEYYGSTFLWIFIQPLGALIAPAFSICLVWGNRHVEMTGFALTVVLFGGSIGGVTYLWVGGHLYDLIGPSCFPYICITSAFLLSGIALSLHLSSRKHGVRDQSTISEDIELNKKLSK